MDENLTVEDAEFLLFCLGMASSILVKDPDEKLRAAHVRVLKKIIAIHEKLASMKGHPRINN